MADHLDDVDLAALAREAERLGYVREAGSHGFRWHDGYSRVLWSLGAAIWWSAPHRTHDDEAAALRWLLRQPEAMARAACYARGVADERARAVAWLRESVAHVAPNGQRAAVLAGGTRLLAADALERGEHKVTRG